MYLFILYYSIYDSSFKKHISEYFRQVLLVDANVSCVPSTIFIVYCCLKQRHLEIFSLHQVPQQLKLFREDK